LFPLDLLEAALQPSISVPWDSPTTTVSQQHPVLHAALPDTSSLQDQLAHALLLASNVLQGRLTSILSPALLVPRAP
jgi:hypothetical protein